MCEPSEQRAAAEELERCRRPAVFIDSDHPAIARHAQEVVAEVDASDAVARAVALYYDVRDGIRYNPYAFALSPARFKASAVLEAREAFCVPKAVLLAALARAVGIPSRLGFADVRNHLASKRLLELMGTDVFAFHGYTELYLEGRWVKATPAFDRGLCARFRVPPLEFDGRSDALLQPFNVEGEQYMEYLRDRGSFEDLPLETMIEVFRHHYPHWFAVSEKTGGSSE